MISHDILSAWTRLLVEYLNGDERRHYDPTTGKRAADKPVTGAFIAKYLERDYSDHGIAPLPFRHRDDAYYEQLRQQANASLRRLVAQQKPTGGDLRRGILWRVPREEVDAIRRGLDSDWLSREDVVTNADQWTIACDLYFGHDESGRLIAKQVNVRSAAAFVALTLNELASTDCRMQVLACPLPGCGRLHIRDLHAKHRPRLYCCEAHATTARSQSRRLKEKRLK
jgi:hypothetical protein